MRHLQEFNRHWQRNWAAVFVTAISVVGCGPTVDVQRVPPTLPDDAAPPLDGCMSPLLVPEGPVWLGPMLISPGGETKQFECSSKYGGTAQFLVRDVFLDSDEVTNGCYRHCVDAGACKPPIDEPDAPAWNGAAQTNIPAILDQERAAAFCAFRGGRLASIAELARASQGSLVSMGSSELVRVWDKCFNEGLKSPECSELASHMRVAGFGSIRPTHAIRSDSRDVGPFGHYDLFGSQVELSITQFPEWYPADWCTPGQTAPLTFSSDPQSYNAYYSPGYTVGALYPTVVDGVPPDVLVAFGWDPLPIAELAGARCAYDVVP